MAIIVSYAFIGILFFSNVRSGEAIDYGIVNFNGVFVSSGIVLRVMTGEDWHQILADARVSVYAKLIAYYSIILFITSHCLIIPLCNEGMAAITCVLIEPLHYTKQ